MAVSVALIAAVARNDVIGVAGRLPFRIPSDLAHFRRLTMGKPIVMGRRQFASVGRPLPGRANIVITRSHDFDPEGVIVCHSLGEAIARASAIAEADGAGEVMVIGGGEVFREALPIADRLYITHVDLSPVGETRFPPIDPGQWSVAGALEAKPSTEDEAGYRIVVYDRRRPASD